MEATGILIGIIVLLGLFFVVWASKNFKRDDSSMEEVLNSEMPYKLEPTEASESGKYPPSDRQELEKLIGKHNEKTPNTTYDVAFPTKSKPKRKYTKRSTYWTTNKPAQKMRKARKARKAKRKSK